MPKIQRDAFTKDQERLFGQAVKRSNRSPALAEIPAWLPGHPIQNQQSCIYWPILLQQRFSQEEDQRESVVMRVAFVPVEPWDAWGPMFRVLEKTLRMPDFFRKPKFKYDVFLSYNSKDREIVSAFAATLKKFDLTVWYDEDDLSDREGITPNLKEAMFDSRIIAAVLGRHGLGPWQDRVELRNSLTNIIKGKKPFALLLTSELNTENDSWHQQVPAPFKDVFLDRLYVPLPPVEELKAFANLPQGRNFSLVQRMIKLLADAIHAD